MPALFQSDFSSTCVPELSPRETKLALALLDRLERAGRAFGRTYLRRIVLRADDDEIVVHD